MLINRKKVKAFFVALLGAWKGVTFDNKRGIAYFAGLWNWVVKAVSPWFDVRYKKDGSVYFQLRDLKKERKRVKKIKRLFGVAE